MFKNKDVLDKIKEAGVAIGTQFLHVYHILHGADPVSIRKMDMIMYQIKFLWDHHTSYDLESFLPDFFIKKVEQRGNAIIDRRLNYISGYVPNEELINDIKRLNKDYSEMLDIIETVSSDEEFVSESKLDEIISHTDQSELLGIDDVDNIEFVSEQVHYCFKDIEEEQEEAPVFSCKK